MEGGDDSNTTGTKRRLMSDDDDDHHSKRSRNSSSSDLSKVMNMDDLPDNLLVQILCRLPSSKLASQCKCVSKRWSSLISDPYFIACFLSVQLDRKETAGEDILINMKGEQLTRSSSSTKLLTPLFDKLVSAHGLEKDPIVVATYNDLVLCCASEYDQRDYYICNPYTTKWEPLPPPPRVDNLVAVGFMCDLPYYSCNKKDNCVQLNDEFRCRVLRIILPMDERYYTKFEVQIFSFQTGVWMESIVSTPSANLKCSQLLDFSRGFAYKGMLYWEGLSYDDYDERILIGFDPFMIDNCSSSTGSDDITEHSRCCFIQLDGGVGEIPPNCLGVYRGCLRMCYLDKESRNVHVWDLNEEGDHEVGRLTIHGAAVKLRWQENTLKVYSLDQRMFSVDEEDEDNNETELLAFDLSNDDILYLRIGRDIVESNIRTQEWSVIAGKRYNGADYFPIVRPWWPTPVPTVQRTSRTQCRTYSFISS